MVFHWDLNYDKEMANTGEDGILADVNTTFTVTFKVDGSTIKTETVGICKTVSQPDISAYPKTDNEEFNGWYTDLKCTKPYEFNQGVTKDLTLYAKYAKTVTVVFENGSTSTFLTIGHVYNGEMSPQSFFCEKPQNLTMNVFFSILSACFWY